MRVQHYYHECDSESYHNVAMMVDGIYNVNTITHSTPPMLTTGMNTHMCMYVCVCV